MMRLNIPGGQRQFAGGTGNRVKNAVFIYSGGEKGLHESLADLKALVDAGVSITVLLTRGAKAILGESAFTQKGLQPEEITFYHRDVIRKADALVVPVLTMNGLSKTALLAADSPLPYLVIDALNFSVPVYLCPHAIVCCKDIGEIPFAIRNQITKYQQQLTAFGAKFINANEIAKTLLAR